ncbi:MAG: hypothetical protein ABH878_00370 [bacterium]
MAKAVKPVKGIKKKELKEDKLVTFYFQAQEWLQKNLKLVLRVGGGAILLIALIAFWFISKSGSEKKATYELGKLTLGAVQYSPETLIEQLKALTEKYSGTKASAEAYFYMGQMQHRMGKLQEALASFEKYTKKGDKGSYLYPAALAGKAACLEDLSRYSEAASAYLEAAAYKKGFFAKPNLQLDAARCFQLAGEPGRAQELYKMIQKENSDSPIAREAEKEEKRFAQHEP